MEVESIWIFQDGVEKGRCEFLSTTQIGFKPALKLNNIWDEITTVAYKAPHQF